MIYAQSEASDSVSEAEVLRIYDLFLTNFSYLKDAQKWDEKEVFINKAILYVAVVSIFDDIKRCKEYSHIEIADRHKVAGYTIKWLSKLKPIQFSSIDNVNILVINSFFALYCGLTFLHITESDIENISSEYFDHLMYSTHYRNISGRSYASKLFLLEKLLSSNISV